MRQHFQRSAQIGPWYDMGIVNHEFATDIHTLSGSALTLDSEWEDANRPGFFGDPVETYSEALVVHFTALGKPWSYTLEEVRSLRPKAQRSSMSCGRHGGGPGQRSWVESLASRAAGGWP